MLIVWVCGILTHSRVAFDDVYRAMKMIGIAHAHRTRFAVDFYVRQMMPPDIEAGDDSGDGAAFKFSVPAICVLTSTGSACPISASLVAMRSGKVMRAEPARAPPVHQVHQGGQIIGTHIKEGPPPSR